MIYVTHYAGLVNLRNEPCGCAIWYKHFKGEDGETLFELHRRIMNSPEIIEPCLKHALENLLETNHAVH